MPTLCRPRILIHFRKIKDPRRLLSTDHLLGDMIFIAIAASIAGADSWVAVEEWAKAKVSWLRKYIELPNGIPSHNTLGRVFSLINPEEFEECFRDWIQSIARASNNRIIAIDGKTLRHSYDRRSNTSAIHMVSAWATENRITLGQLKVSDKSNEITAIPKLLDLLNIGGALVTIDAMGCQRKIVAKIIEKKADYLISLKGNQGTLHEAVKAKFNEIETTGYEGTEHEYFETNDKGHGRRERRRYWLVEIEAEGELAEDWVGIGSIAKVESTRTIGETTTVETRYFISSLKRSNFKLLAKAVRDHWGIENNLHWVLDVAFDEDKCRIRMGDGAENMSILRKIALQLLMEEKTAKVGTRIKRQKAGWDDRYLEQVLGLDT